MAHLKGKQALTQAELESAMAEKEKANKDWEVTDKNADAKAKFSKDKIIITYIDRQGVRRHLIDEDHAYLVDELRALADANGYELNIVRAETLTKEQQLALVARTTVSINPQLSHNLY